MVTRFSTTQLEELLTSSTKNVAHEVVSCMIPKQGDSGLLLILEKEIRDIKRNNQSGLRGGGGGRTTTNASF